MDGGAVSKIQAPKPLYKGPLWIHTVHPMHDRNRTGERRGWERRERDRGHDVPLLPRRPTPSRMTTSKAALRSQQETNDALRRELEGVGMGAGNFEQRHERYRALARGAREARRRNRRARESASWAASSGRGGSCRARSST